jgi:aarF domain-containing kinase
MIVALEGNSAECVKLMKQIGLKLDRTTTDIEIIIAYLLFDTRMDIKEAKISPLTLELPPELQVVSLSEIDSDIFMIIRIVSMFRGILTSQGVDVHARSIWYLFALAVLYRNGEYHYHSSQTDLSQNANSLREQMKELSRWMQSHNLPHNRDALLPFALAGIFNISELRRVILLEKEYDLAAIFRNFSDSDMKRCLLMVGNM